MTTPLSLTSSRYTGAAARRSLERTSVVSSITSCPIHASGIFPCEALCLSLSITGPPLFVPLKVSYLCRGEPVALRQTEPRAKRRLKDRASTQPPSHVKRSKEVSSSSLPVAVVTCSSERPVY